MRTESIKAVKIALPIKQTRPLISFLGPLLLATSTWRHFKSLPVKSRDLKLLMLWKIYISSETLTRSANGFQWHKGVHGTME